MAVTTYEIGNASLRIEAERIPGATGLEITPCGILRTLSLAAVARAVSTNSIAFYIFLRHCDLDQGYES
jgi:hypothetical protein